jgi:hypothetical protein
LWAISVYAGMSKQRGVCPISLEIRRNRPLSSVDLFLRQARSGHAVRRRGFGLERHVISRIQAFSNLGTVVAQYLRLPDHVEFRNRQEVPVGQPGATALMSREPEKGKPSERAGRKATGLSPLRIRQQGCQADTAPLSCWISPEKSHRRWYRDSRGSRKQNFSAGCP